MTSNLKFFKLWSPIASEEALEELVQLIDKARDSELKELATKKDLMEVRVEMKEMKSEIIKWVFLFILGQTATLIAVIKLI